MQPSRLMSLLVATGLVCLLALASAAQSPPSPPSSPAGATVTIKNFAYTPASLTIRPGQSVTWVNADDRDHTIASPDGTFASGNLSPGASFTVTFKTSGRFTYGCSLHPRMRGTVLVAEQ